MRIDLISSAGINVTYKCTAACAHCSVGCAPDRKGSYMDEKAAERICDILKRNGCRSVHIGGGEPFMNFSGLLTVCEVLKRNGIATEYIETNGSWYTNDERCGEMLERLFEVGVDCLLISIDPFHNEFIAYSKMRDLTALCRRTGMGTFIWPGTFDRELARIGADKTHTLDEYSAFYKTDYRAYAAEKYGLVACGRALELYHNSCSLFSADKIAGDAAACRLNRTGHCHFDLFGRYNPPNCYGLWMDMDDIGKELSPEKYPIINLIHSEGVAGLLKRAREMGYTEREDGYFAKCDLCFSLRKFLIKVCPSDDLGPEDYYSNVDY